MLGGIKVLVLDEADEMLDLGFLPDMERVLAMVPDGQADDAVLRDDARPDPHPGPDVHVPADAHPGRGWPPRARPTRSTKQYVYRAHALDKVEMLARVLQARDRGLTMVFTRTKRTAAKVADELTERGFAAAAVHGDLGQGAREQALRAFRSGKVDVLVATDVAARGIDVEDVTHVINYQCPEEDKTYIHRIGRTGRAGKTGIAVSFIDWDDVPRWKLINEALGLDFADPAETYSTSKHLYADLDIPEGITGRLPSRAADPGRAGRRGGRGPRRDRRQAVGAAARRHPARAAMADDGAGDRQRSAGHRPRTRGGRSDGGAPPPTRRPPQRTPDAAGRAAPMTGDADASRAGPSPHPRRGGPGRERPGSRRARRRQPRPRRS